LPLCETPWFSFRYRETDRMFLTMCVFEKFLFSSQKKISLTLGKEEKVAELAI